MRYGVVILAIAVLCVAVVGLVQQKEAAAAACCSAASGSGCCAAGAECCPGAVKLFNGKDLTGLKGFIPDENVDPASVWSVKDGVLVCKGNPAGYIRTTEKYSNYRLCFQWRWSAKKGGNSGCLLHIQDKDAVWPKSIESQLHSGDAGDFWVIGGTSFKEHTNEDDRRVPKQKRHNEKPAGEWNQMMVLCDGNSIQVAVNGELQNVATDTTVSEGFIGWQSEGTPIEFRCLCLTPIDKMSEEQRKNWMECPMKQGAQKAKREGS